MKKKVYVIVTEHFDIMWRRPFDRDFQFKGKNYVSYADLEAYYIMDNLALCDKYPEYKFTIESVAVLRKFLEHHPEYEEKLREFYKDGRVFTNFSGDNIVDSNMVQGESIVRNYLYGLEYLKDNFDFVPYGMDRNDAFGNSGQLPQIARGFDCKWIYHLAYTQPDHSYWRGIDGSTVYCDEPTRVGSIGTYFKYAPCPVCNGFKSSHCEACGDRRIDISHMETRREKLKSVNDDFIKNSKIPGYIYVGGEEILPTADIMQWVKENEDKYEIQFAGYDTYAEELQTYIDRVDEVDDNELHSMQEINANNTGTYVTRIDTKKKVRKNENLISTVETLGTILGMNQGKYYSEYIKKMWEKLHYTMFHDAITATHVDAANDEMMEICDFITDSLIVTLKEMKRKFADKTEKTITVFNTLGIKANCMASIKVPGNENTVLKDQDGNDVTIIRKVVCEEMVEIIFAAGLMKPFETKNFMVEQSEIEKSDIVTYELVEENNWEPILTNVTADMSVSDEGNHLVIENEFYRVTAETNGITAVYDRVLGRNVAEKSEYYVGEFILEHDEGSPWATLSEDMSRIPLSGNTKLVEYENGKDIQKLTFQIRAGYTVAHTVTGLKIEYSVALYKGVKRVDFNSKILWDTQNYRLRVAFPVSTVGKHIYEIPYGYIERKPYEPNIIQQNGDVNWASAAGDWPAINWAGIQGRTYSIALINKGTPSYQIDMDKRGKENIYLSVLRSPSVSTYLHDPAAYSMTDYDGMRDAGKHEFVYALVSYEAGFDKNMVVSDAYAFNCEAVTWNGNRNGFIVPDFESQDARISAMKHSQKGDMIIFRIVEYHGVDAEFELSMPDNVKVKAAWEMNLGEKPIREIVVENNKIRMKIGKFKIKTIAVEISN